MALTVHLDTNAYSAFIRGQPEAVFIIEHSPELALSPIVVGELKAGFLLGRRSGSNLAALERVLNSPRTTIPPLDDRVTDSYAGIYKQLRRDGRPIPTNDLWIAACALGEESGLFTLDAHFAFIDGLRVLRGSADLKRLLAG